MNDLKIPNLNKSSNKYLFKKKVSLRKKSKSKLIKESFIMLFLSALIIYLNFLIPDKTSIFYNLNNNINKLSANLLDSIYYLYEICLLIFIIISLILAVVLILGSISRMIKVVKRKPNRIQLK